MRMLINFFFILYSQTYYVISIRIIHFTLLLIFKQNMYLWFFMFYFTINEIPSHVRHLLEVFWWKTTWSSVKWPHIRTLAKSLPLIQQHCDYLGCFIELNFMTPTLLNHNNINSDNFSLEFILLSVIEQIHSLLNIEIKFIEALDNSD